MHSARIYDPKSIRSVAALNALYDSVAPANTPATTPAQACRMSQRTAP